jgi:hypothetical protein
LSTESRHSAVRNRSAVINNAYLHAKHNAMAMAGPKQVCAPRFTFALPLVFVLTLAHSRSRSPLTQEKSEARWRDYAADHYSKLCLASSCKSRRQLFKVQQALSGKHA